MTIAKPDKKLPDGWRYAKLGEVCRVFAGSAAPQGKQYFDADGPFFFRVSDLSQASAEQNMYLAHAKDQLSQMALDKLRLTPVKQGAVVFPKSGAAIATNNRAILDVDGYLVSHLMALEPGDSIMSAWVYYAMLRIDMMDWANNAGYPSIQQAAIKEIPIPLPPLAEQRRIVAALEAQLAAVARARNAAAEILSAVEALNRALMRKFLPFERQKLPRGWKWVTLGEIADFLNNIRKPVNEEDRNKRNANKPVADLYPYYGANGQVGLIDDYLLDGPSILLAEDGGFFGSSVKPIAYRVEGKYWVNNHAHILRPKGMVYFDYLFYVLSVRPDVGAMVAGATRPKLNKAVAETIPVPLPPLAEQRRIVAALEAQTAAADGVKRAAADALNALRELPRALLRQALAGES